MTELDPLPRRPLRAAVTSLVTSSLLARVIGLGVSLLVAAVLTPTALGEFALVSASVALVASGGTLGLSTLLTREVARAEDPREAREATAFVLGFCVVLLGLVVLVVAVLCLPGLGPLRLPGVGSASDLAIVAIWALGVGLNPLVFSVVTGHRAFAASSHLLGARAVAVGIGTTLAALVFDSAESTAAGAAVGEFVVLVAGLSLLARRKWWANPLTRRLARYRSLVVRGMQSGAAALAISAALWLGQVVLSKSSDGLVANALFLLMSRLMLVVTLVPNALGTVALPALIDPHQTERERRLRRTRMVRATMASSILAATALALCAYMLLPRLDPAYGGYGLPIVVLSATGVAVSANNILGSIALAEHRVQPWIISDWVLAGILAAGSLIAVPALGLIGLSATHAIAYSVSVRVLVGRPGKRPSSTEGSTSCVS